MSQTRHERHYWIGQHLPAGRVTRLLDVGCHTGDDATEWTDHAETLFGIDVDPAIFRGEGPMQRCQASGNALPFSDRAFEIVTCSEVLEHVPVEVERPLIEECRRVLRNDGLFLFTTPHAGWFAWMDPLDAKRRLRLRSGKGHKHYSMQEIEVLFDGLFTIEELHLSSLFLHPLSTWMGFGDQRRWERVRGRISDWDYQRSFGGASFNMALTARPI